MDPDEASPLVNGLARLVLWLRGHGPHGLLKRRIHSLGTDLGIEAWATGALIAALLGFACSGSAPWLSAVVVAAAAIRLFEILVNAVHVTLFHGFIDKKPLAGPRRIVILLLFNYIELVFWFAAAYRALLAHIVPASQASPVAILAHSLSAASGFGDGAISQVPSLMSAIAIFESGVGLFMAVAVIARFVSLLPRPPGDARNGDASPPTRAA